MSPPSFTLYLSAISKKKRAEREREREREKERELDNNNGMHTDNHDNFKLNILTK